MVQTTNMLSENYFENCKVSIRYKGMYKGQTEFEADNVLKGKNKNIDFHNINANFEKVTLDIYF